MRRTRRDLAKTRVKVITPDRFDAVLFDLDGVLTSTARIHSQCWKTTFDEFLSTGRRRLERPSDRSTSIVITGSTWTASSAMTARGTSSPPAAISLPEGTPADPPTALTVCGIGNRKDEHVEAAIDRGEVEVYVGSVELVRRLRESGIRTAVVSSSNNCERVLRAGDILNLFDARVDGVVASELGLPGKPAPDMFLRPRTC